MRYSLRTLLIVMLLGGPALAGLWKWPGKTLATGILLASLREGGFFRGSD